MKIEGKGTETYLYINGLKVNRPLRLSDNVELLPAESSPSPDSMISVSKTEVDFGITAVFLRQVTSQLKITSEAPESLVILAWNSLWDAVLLSAIYDCEAACNFQSDKPAEEFGSESYLSITNYHMRGLTFEPYELTQEDEIWIKSNYQKAKKLTNNNVFQDAVHSMETYRFHSLPKARLAIIWSGIEGLFGIQQELVFRLSLYIAHFLEPEDKEKRKQLFNSVKQLYKHRSSAVHGSKIKGKPHDHVVESAELLNRLIHKCIEHDGVPDVDELAI
ncbi:MAG: hypothetical protein ABJ000_04820 [Saccharospirillum sp.]|uniref:hypothetical protein n=1 Tax=Saccharospirillum sp. TaxID=2033801 RepID=UPI003297B291